MKKAIIISICLLFICLIFLSGCSQKSDSETTDVAAVQYGEEANNTEIEEEANTANYTYIGENSDCKVYIVDDLQSEEGLDQYISLYHEGWSVTKPGLHPKFVNTTCRLHGYTFIDVLEGGDSNVINLFVNEKTKECALYLNSNAPEGWVSTNIMDFDEIDAQLKISEEYRRAVCEDFGDKYLGTEDISQNKESSEILVVKKINQ